MDEVILYSDGGSRGNPGPAACGVLLTKPDGTILREEKRALGRRTNNQAEYMGLIRALELAKSYGAKRVRSVMDSELLVKQMKGEYKVRNPGLKPLYRKVKELEKGFEKVQYRHVRRENPKIQIADRLVNEALDEKVKGC